ncbi:MAG: SH3 domain-containing protein [Chloroflexota bacterium]
MPDTSQKRAFQLAALCAVFVTMLLVLSFTAVVAAQDGQPQPTSEFSFDLQPTFPAAGVAEPTLDPQMLPSLTGVGGRPLNANVSVRSGPGLDYKRISFVKQGSWIDIVGWNGWAAGRVCSLQFENDLDMWVQVPLGAGYGWVARCVLEIRGILTDLPIVSASGDRALQR